MNKQIEDYYYIWQFQKDFFVIPIYVIKNIFFLLGKILLHLEQNTRQMFTISQISTRRTHINRLIQRIIRCDISTSVVGADSFNLKMERKYYSHTFLAPHLPMFHVRNSGCYNNFVLFSVASIYVHWTGWISFAFFSLFLVVDLIKIFVVVRVRYFFLAPVAREWKKVNTKNVIQFTCIILGMVAWIWDRITMMKRQ